MNAMATPPPPPPGSDLSGREREVFVFMVKFYVANDQFPPLRVISQHIGTKSGTGGNWWTNRLEEKGYFEDNAVRNRMLTQKGWEAAKHLVGLEPPRLDRPGMSHG